jgi:hypothetical protein
MHAHGRAREHTHIYECYVSLQSNFPHVANERLVQVPQIHLRTMNVNTGHSGTLCIGA